MFKTCVAKTFRSVLMQKMQDLKSGAILGFALDMKRLVLSDMSKYYDILYKGRRIYKNLSAEDCTEVLQDFSEKFYEGENLDLNEFIVEESHGS